eukprot:g24102.t1
MACVRTFCYRLSGRGPPGGREPLNETVEDARRRRLKLRGKLSRRFNTSSFNTSGSCQPCAKLSLPAVVHRLTWLGCGNLHMHRLGGGAEARVGMVQTPPSASALRRLTAVIGQCGRHSGWQEALECSEHFRSQGGQLDTISSLALEVGAWGSWKPWVE